MKVFGLQAPVYRGAALASRLTAKTSDIAAVRRDALARWQRARANGLSAEEAARAVGASRATLYRWHKRLEPRSRRPHRLRQPTATGALVRAVERLRAEHPMWGKRKIAALLRREGIDVSVSMVGRILKTLMDRGVVTPVPILRRRPGGRRFRMIAKRHARRLPKGLKPTRPGELVQIDTLFVNVRPDRAVKHFTAYDPVAKWTLATVAGRATAACAEAVLDKLLAEAPFPVKGIQVDGGSEFRAAFERACQDKGLTLFVLPPKRPQLNGAVERAQGTWRYEFYACHDLPARLDKLQLRVDAFAHHFNHHRPHQALGDQTPAEYLSTFRLRDPNPSHM
jgi:transposase InsO family protein